MTMRTDAGAYGVNVGAEARGRAAAPRSVDDLLGLDHDALKSLYEGAAPPPIPIVSGALKGRMLAVPAFPDWVTKWPRAWARTGSFPWRGKSFTPLSEDGGEGINRVFSDRLTLFRFTTKIAPSRHDGQPTFELDYDHPGNPWFIRRIEDEIREVSPGLYLGQAYFRTKSGPFFVLWFGLQRR
jgi:hypothetical protein